MKSSVLLSLGVLAFASCEKSKEGNVVRREGNPDYFRIDNQNEGQMDAAIDAAKKDIDIFLSALQSPTATQDHFSVKKPFPWKDGDSTSHEHIWMSDVSFKDGKFHARVGNEPVDVPGLKLGDEVTFEKSDISDWMFIDDGFLIGGRTLVVLRDQMSEAEQKEFDASFPYKIKKS